MGPLRVYFQGSLLLIPGVVDLATLRNNFGGAVMRILHVTVEYPPVIYGGLGTAVGGVVEASAGAGLQVAVLLVRDAPGAGYGGVPPANRNSEVIGAGGPPVVTVGWADAASTAVALTRAWRPDVLHLHVFWLWRLAEEVRRATGVPVVYTVHSLDRAEYEVGEGPPECLTQWDLQAATIGGADRVIALTSSERTLVSTYCPDATPRVRVVGNGISINRTARRSSSAAAPLVLFSGRFVDRKGIRDLLAAIPTVLAAAPTTRFVLAGGARGETAEQMDRWWRPSSLEGDPRVTFTGWLNAEEMTAWYRKADILVVPSWYEPFGMVVLEGMLHGLAIAAANVGGPSEILVDGVTGRLFPPRDVAALSQVLIALAGSRSARRRLGRQARLEVTRSWAWPRILPTLCNVYYELTPVERGAA